MAPVRAMLPTNHCSVNEEVRDRGSTSLLLIRLRIVRLAGGE